MSISLPEICSLFCCLGKISRQEDGVDISKLRLGEGECKRCGMCCYDKILNKAGKVQYLDTHCRHLSMDNNCFVYEHKNIIMPTCLNAKQALLLCILPKDCGYVRANWNLIKEWYTVPEQ